MNAYGGHFKDANGVVTEDALGAVENCDVSVEEVVAIFWPVHLAPHLRDKNKTGTRVIPALRIESETVQSSKVRHYSAHSLLLNGQREHYNHVHVVLPDH